MQEKESKSNWHFRISLFKSCLRFAAAIAMIKNDFISAGVLFILAEVLGITEEL